MPIRATWAVASVLFGLAACAGDSADEHTWAAVRNGGTASIDATVSDGASELRFERVAAGTTSNYQSVLFGALSGLTVSVGGVTSTISLIEKKGNVISVAADGKVSGVMMVQVSVGTDGVGAW